MKSTPRLERELREEIDALRKRIADLEEEANRSVQHRIVARGVSLDPKKLTVGTISYPCTDYRVNGPDF